MELKVGQGVWTGTRGGVIEQILGDQIVVRFVEDKDYQIIEYSQTFSRAFIEECIREKTKQDLARERDRRDKTNEAIAKANTVVLVSGSRKHVTCSSCNAVIGYGESDKRPHYFNKEVQFITCKACGNDIRIFDK